MATDKPTTYVLAGYDWNGVLRREVAALEGRNDVVVLRPMPGESMEDLAKKIVRLPANIILATHGNEDGTFKWSENGDFASYNDLFKALPREGVELITICSCYGSSAMDMLWEVPHGTLVQSIVGRVQGRGFSVTRFGKELSERDEMSRLSILLEALDNVDPTLFKRAKDKDNQWVDRNPHLAKQWGVTREELDPNAVLPHIIGIGGNPPIEINLNEKLAFLTSQGPKGGLASPNFKKAVELVKEHFDSNAGDQDSFHGADGVTRWFGIGDEGGVADNIDAVVEKLKKGEALTLEEKRIGYAIAVAHLETSGAMDRLVEQSKKPPSWINWDGKGSETVARLQALAEKSGIPTDKGGANDNRVTGIEDDLSRALFAKWEEGLDIPENLRGDNERLLDILVHKGAVMKMVGRTQDADGDFIANIPLRKTDTPSPER